MSNSLFLKCKKWSLQSNFRLFLLKEESSVKWLENIKNSCFFDSFITMLTLVVFNKLNEDELFNLQANTLFRASNILNFPDAEIHEQSKMLSKYRKILSTENFSMYKNQIEELNFLCKISFESSGICPFCKHESPIIKKELAIVEITSELIADCTGDIEGCLNIILGGTKICCSICKKQYYKKNNLKMLPPYIFVEIEPIASQYMFKAPDFIETSKYINLRQEDKLEEYQLCGVVIYSYKNTPSVF